MRLAARLVHFEPSSRLISASIHCRAVSMMFETFRLRLQKRNKDAQFEQTLILPLILCSFASGAVLHTSLEDWHHGGPFLGVCPSLCYSCCRRRSLDFAAPCMDERKYLNRICGVVTLYN